MIRGDAGSVRMAGKEADKRTWHSGGNYDIVNKVCLAPYVHNNKYRTSWTWSEFKHRISDTSDSEDTKQNAGSSKTDGANTSQKMHYVVQCGAFAERKNAEAMARQLQEKGFTAIVKTA